MRALRDLSKLIEYWIEALRGVKDSHATGKITFVGANTGDGSAVFGNESAFHLASCTWVLFTLGDQHWQPGEGGGWCFEDFEVQREKTFTAVCLCLVDSAV